MSDQHIPDFLDISPEAQAAAAAAMSRKLNWDPPETAYVSTNEKNGDVYERWTEEVVVENAWRETTKGGLISAVVQIKSRPGNPNEHERTWGRHTMHPAVLARTADSETTAKYSMMNDRAINAITTLLKSTGFSTEGGLTGKLLNFIFPLKNAPGAKSPLIGKIVVANVLNSPNKGEKAKSPRQTSVDSYLPEME